MTTLAAIDAYSRLAAAYDRLPNPIIALEQGVVEAMLPPLAGLLVADVAAGTGRWSAYCLRGGARTVAVDISREMLNRAPGRRMQADMLRLPLRDACADLTICALGIGYAPKALAELERVTRPGGMVIISDVHPEALRSGWKRSFRLGGETVEVASEIFELGDLKAEALELVSLNEPSFGELERRIIEAEGKGATFEDAARHPAIFVAQWVKR